MRHGERIKHIHASGDPTADRHFADAEKFGAFAEVNGGFEVHTKSIVSTGGLRVVLLQSREGVGFAVSFLRFV